MNVISIRTQVGTFFYETTTHDIYNYTIIRINLHQIFHNTAQLLKNIISNNTIIKRDLCFRLSSYFYNFLYSNFYNRFQFLE